MISRQQMFENTVPDIQSTQHFRAGPSLYVLSNRHSVFKHLLSTDHSPDVRDKVRVALVYSVSSSHGSRLCFFRTWYYRQDRVESSVRTVNFRNSCSHSLWDLCCYRDVQSFQYKAIPYQTIFTY